MTFGARQQWMDFARGICIILVIFVHSYAALAFSGIDYPSSFKTFNDLFDPYRMPLLMFLSGLLLHRAFRKSAVDNIRGKFDLIFWPFLIWSMAVYAAEERFTLIFILKTPITAPSVFWYLWFLFVYYILAIFIERFKLPVLVICVVSLVMSIFLPGIGRIDRFFYLFAFFMLGHLVAIRDLQSRASLPLAAIGFLAACVGSYISATESSIKYNAFYVWAPLGLIALVVYASQFYRTLAVTRPIEWIGRNSIVFYAIHFPFLVVFTRIVFRGTDTAPEVVYCTAFAATVLAASVMQMLRSRSLFVAALFDFGVIRNLFVQRRPISTKG